MVPFLPNIHTTRGRGCGQVVSVLAFYSDDPSSNTADATAISLKFVY